MQVIDKLKSLGYKVYKRDIASQYCYVVKGDNVAYVQWSGIVPRICTVHKPCKYNGTGFLIGSDIDKVTIDKALKTSKPYWEKTNTPVIKYKNWNDFYNADNWNKGFFEV